MLTMPQRILQPIFLQTQTLIKSNQKKQHCNPRVSHIRAINTCQSQGRWPVAKKRSSSLRNFLVSFFVVDEHLRGAKRLQPRTLVTPAISKVQAVRSIFFIITACSTLDFFKCLTFARSHLHTLGLSRLRVSIISSVATVGSSLRRSFTILFSTPA